MPESTNTLAYLPGESTTDKKGFIPLRSTVQPTIQYPYSRSREPLLKGKAQYSWPPYINLLRSAVFYWKYYLPFFTKQVTLVRRSTVLRIPLQLEFLGRWIKINVVTYNKNLKRHKLCCLSMCCKKTCYVTRPSYLITWRRLMQKN